MMEKKIYCPFCGNPSLIDDNSELRKTNLELLEQLDQARSIDQEWFNDATSTINELRQRAEAAEARAAELLEHNREQAEAITTLRAERDQLLTKAQPMKGIPIIAEITPHPDPVYGHCFQWPAQEVDQFIEMIHADQDQHDRIDRMLDASGWETGDDEEV